MTSKLRVLVIDDSAYNRQIISEFLTSSPEFEVVGKADDGEQGLKLVAQLKPDLITLDVEMPRMDGFTFLRLLMSQMPTPVIVISSHSKKQEVFQALELGALDFVAKPDRFLHPNLNELRDEIVRKAMAVRALQVLPLVRRSRATSAHTAEALPPPTPIPESTAVQRLIAIGASTGGPPALQSILKVLTAGTPTAVVIAQHMPEKFTRAFAERLDRLAQLDVVEAEDGALVRSGYAYIAPGGCHMEIAQGRDGLFVRLSPATPADRYMPSVDRLFASVAKLRGLKLLGVVLTGMGADGADGVRALRAAGARTIAESEESAIVFGMPKEAINTRCIDEVLALDGIIERLHTFGASP